MCKDLITTQRDADDYDNTLDDATGISPPVDLLPSPDLEDAVTEEHPSVKHNPCFELDGKQIYKARYLNQAFENLKKPRSTD